MDLEAVTRYFDDTLQNDSNLSEAVAAIKTLLEFIRRSNAETVSGLRSDLKAAIDTLTSSDHHGLITAKSGCELFLRFITLCALDIRDFQQCKETMITRGNDFLKRTSQSRERIAHIAHPFVVDGSTILTHSRSRVVLQLLKEAAGAKKRFKVYVTESLPDRSGEKMCKELQAEGIDAILILDAAIGYIMEKVDIVLVGAEGVVESGGIINKIGTCTMAICAKEMHKPVYVVAESFKFTRTFPLNQQDVPREFQYRAPKLACDLNRENPMVDYTPPAYLNLLFTDLGILTPSAVSDELINLYL
jgi:translation initiation factor eIF-2B subunit alpha